MSAEQELSQEPSKLSIKINSHLQQIGAVQLGQIKDQYIATAIGDLTTSPARLLQSVDYLTQNSDLSGSRELMSRMTLVVKEDKWNKRFGKKEYHPNAADMQEIIKAMKDPEKTQSLIAQNILKYIFLQPTNLYHEGENRTSTVSACNKAIDIGYLFAESLLSIDDQVCCRHALEFYRKEIIKPAEYPTFYSFLILAGYYDIPVETNKAYIAYKALKVFDEIYCGYGQKIISSNEQSLYTQADGLAKRFKFGNEKSKGFTPSKFYSHINGINNEIKTFEKQQINANYYIIESPEEDKVGNEAISRYMQFQINRLKSLNCQGEIIGYTYPVGTRVKVFSKYS